MKKLFLAFTILFVIISCSSDKKGTMVVSGQIKGLKKGTLYLQKMKDTFLISVDSVALLGNDTFTLSDKIKEPIMYYLTFDGNTSEKHLMFFGEEGTITVNDKVDKFGFAPQISGSKNQVIIEKFKKIDKKFINQRLDYIQQSFEARTAKNDTLAAKIEQDFNKMLRKRFLFTTQFANNNAHSEAAPYIALTELYDANITLLDTINNSLAPKIKSSYYGKRLQKFIDEVKTVDVEKN